MYVFVFVTISLCCLCSESGVLVLDSPERCSKMPRARLLETTVIPERCVVCVSLVCVGLPM